MKNYQIVILFWAALLGAVLFQYSVDDLITMYHKQLKIDSIGHFFGFFFLSWLIHLVLKTSLAKTAIAVTIYAILSEYGQYYVGYRNGEVGDAIADITGIMLFLVIRKSYLFIKASKINNVISH